MDWSVLAGLPVLPAPAARRRKGATTRASVPRAVRAALNAGRDETITLVEWLAIDMVALLRAAGEDARLGAATDELCSRARARQDEKFTARVKAIGRDLCATLAAMRNPRARLVALAGHPSDMVRAWLAYAHGADESLSLAERLRVAKRFAADRAMSVREGAWDALRPHLARELPEALRLLRGWVVDADPNVRRCAIEGTRPRGVWCAHLDALKRDPAPGLVLLEPVRSDPARYVLTSAANWLNDASKDQPSWVVSVTDRWLAESDTAETRWLVSRARRTLERGHGSGRGSPRRASRRR